MYTHIEAFFGSSVRGEPRDLGTLIPVRGSNSVRDRKIVMSAFATYGGLKPYLYFANDARRVSRALRPGTDRVSDGRDRLE